MSRIVGSDAGSPLRLRVANIGPLDDIAPEPSANCEINVPGTHALFVDYSRATHGTNDSGVVGFDERVTLDADDTGRPLLRYGDSSRNRGRVSRWPSLVPAQPSR